MKPSRIRHRLQGFTLIEVMIVVAIIGILAAIAYPSYQDEVRKSRRSAAQGVLLEVASRQQQLYLDARQFVAAANAGEFATTAIRVGVDTKLQNFYDFNATTPACAGGRPCFTVTATPKAAQAADKCGTMTINESNVKTAAAGCGGSW